MFNFFKSTDKSNLDISKLSVDDKNVLIASVLIECAKEDGSFEESEMNHIKSLFKRKMNLTDSAIAELISNALNESNERIELYSLTKKIRDTFSHEEILQLFVLMWEIILIDGKIDDFESSLIRKAIGLFHITGKESSEAKLIATENIKLHKS